MRLLACLLLLALAAVPGPARAQSELRIALQDDPDSLDPALNWTFVGRHVLQSLCDKVVDLDPQGNIVPMLATGWAWSEDGKTLTLSLRDGVTFHDGTSFDAEAVRFNLERALTMKGSRRRAEIEAIDTVEAVGKLEVRIRLKTPSVQVLAALSDRAGMIVSPTAAQAPGADLNARPVCAGPYRFVEHRAQDRLVLERFPAHWRAADYHMDRLVFRPMPDSTVRLLNLRSGTLDLIERLGPTDVPQVQADKALAVQEVTGLGYYNLTFDIGGPGANPAFAQHAAVRQALALAIDRDAINQVAFSGRYAPGNQPFPPDSPWYDKAQPVPARDVAAARAKLAEAGLKAVTLDLIVPTDPERQQVGQIIQSMAAEAGITVNVSSMELISLLARGREGNFQAYIVGWSGRPDPDLNITPMLSCGAAGNDGRYCNKELDATLAEARMTADPARRHAAYARAVKTLLADMPTIYLYHSKWIFAHKAGVKGFKPYADGIIRLNGVTLAR